MTPVVACQIGITGTLLWASFRVANPLLVTRFVRSQFELARKMLIVSSTVLDLDDIDERLGTDDAA